MQNAWLGCWLRNSDKLAELIDEPDGPADRAGRGDVAAVHRMQQAFVAQDYLSELRKHRLHRPHGLERVLAAFFGVFERRRVVESEPGAFCPAESRKVRP